MNDIILTGYVSKDHVHLHVSSPPGLAPSKIAQYIKGRSFLICVNDIGAGTFGHADTFAPQLAKLQKKMGIVHKLRLSAKPSEFGVISRSMAMELPTAINFTPTSMYSPLSRS